MSKMEIPHMWAEHLPGDCALHLNAPVCEQSALALEGALNEAFGYYQYDTATLRITSDGGQLPSLLHMLAAMDRWQLRGKIIKTDAVFRASSAAALLLARGTIGSRAITLHTALRFHHTRIQGGGNDAVTSDAAHGMATALFREDKRLIGGLLQHFESGFGGVAKMAQEGLARCLLIAQGLNVKSRTAAGRIVVKRPTWLTAASRGFSACLAAGQSQPYAKLLMCRFGADSNMDAREAYALLLVDRVNDLPQLVPCAGNVPNQQSNLTRPRLMA